MPTALPRVQTLFQPDTYAKVRQLAKFNRRSSSYSVVELVEEMLATDKYKVLLDYIAEKEGEVPTQKDTRSFIPAPRTEYPKTHAKEVLEGGKQGETANWWEVA